MAALKNACNYTIGILKQSQISQTTDMLSSQFHKNESLCFRMKSEDIQQTIFNMLRRYSDTTSIIVNTSNNKVLASTLACDFVEDDLDDFTYPESLNPITNLMEQIKPSYFSHIGLRDDFCQQKTIFYQIFTGVVPEHRGLGYAKEVIQHNIMLAKQKGYLHIRGDFTSRKSLSIGLKVGYKTLFELSYDDIEIEGQNPKNYWREVPKLLKEDKMFVANLYLEEFQGDMNNKTFEENRIEKSNRSDMCML